MADEKDSPDRQTAIKKIKRIRKPTPHSQTLKGDLSASIGSIFGSKSDVKTDPESPETTKKEKHKVVFRLDSLNQDWVNEDVPPKQR